MDKFEINFIFLNTGIDYWDSEYANLNANIENVYDKIQTSNNLELVSRITFIKNNTGCSSCKYICDTENNLFVSFLKSYAEILQRLFDNDDVTLLIASELCSTVIENLKADLFLLQSYSTPNINKFRGVIIKKSKCELKCDYNLCPKRIIQKKVHKNIYDKNYETFQKKYPFIEIDKIREYSLAFPLYDDLCSEVRFGTLYIGQTGETIYKIMDPLIGITNAYDGRIQCTVLQTKISKNQWLPPIYIYNVHQNYPSYDKLYYAIRDIVSDKSRNIIIGGDFNGNNYRGFIRSPKWKLVKLDELFFGKPFLQKKYNSINDIPEGVIKTYSSHSYPDVSIADYIEKQKTVDEYEQIVTLFSEFKFKRIDLTSLYIDNQTCGFNDTVIMNKNQYMMVFYKFKDYDVIINQDIVEKCEYCIRASSHIMVPLKIIPKLSAEIMRKPSEMMTESNNVFFNMGRSVTSKSLSPDLISNMLIS